MSKVIFLDVDGVLNNRYSMMAGKGIFNVHRPCVARLSQLCSRTGAVCVLTSTWRHNWPIVAFQEFLERHGFTGSVIDKTEYMPGHIRGHEINRYLERCYTRAYPISSFVILDDGNDMGELIEYLVRTETEIGLDQNHVELAVEILGEV